MLNSLHVNKCSFNICRHDKSAELVHFGNAIWLLYNTFTAPVFTCGIGFDMLWDWHTPTQPCCVVWEYFPYESDAQSEIVIDFILFGYEINKNIGLHIFRNL